MIQPLVVTLMVPRDKKQESRFFHHAWDALKARGFHVAELEWLSDNEACDITVEGADFAELKKNVTETVESHPIDFAVQPKEGRRKKLLISDMDSTLIGQECIDELADFVGKKEEVSAITERAMRGELDFKEALTHRVSLLKGLREDVLQRAFDERITMNAGGRELVETMRANGAYTLLVSGGFTFFTSRVRDALGFQEDHSNVLDVAEGALTGKVVPPILDKEAKLASLKTTCARLGISTHDVMAIGDGANDLPMIKEAGMGVAYRAKPVVRAEADMALNHCDLSALLFVQGYKKQF
ncbi:MAG: phosphoserine phosphatase SerB [Rickettsiales bacterium]